VIGRFLLGSGLGALVGTGLLALASIVAPGPDPRALERLLSPGQGEGTGGTPPAADPAPEAAAEPAPAVEAAPAEAAPDAAPATADPGPDEPAPVEAAPAESASDEPATETAPEPAPVAPAPAAEPAPAANPAPDVAPAEPVAPEAEAAPSETDGQDGAAAPDAATGVAPAEDAPALATESAADPAPEVPAAPEAAPPPAVAAAPDALPAADGTATDDTSLTAEAAPDAAATPDGPLLSGSDTAPEVAAAAPAPAPVAAPPVPAAPALPAPVEPTVEVPVADSAPGQPADAALPPTAAPEPAPVADAPAPPPLTPEEEELLARITEEGAEAPPVADAPAPPPLTPEEEALLARIAEEGPDAVLPPEAAPAPEIAPEPAEDAARIELGEESSTLPSAPALDEKIAGITTDRLPRIGDDAPAETPADEAAAADAGALVDDRPIVRNARAFENPDARPRFSVILVDTGEADLDRAALAGLPFPVSFAIDPLADGAADRAAIYRAAGQEVILLATGLPRGASAADVEVAFQAMLRDLPVAVAVMDPPDHAFQGDRMLSALVVPVVGASGLGLVTWDQGLNAADQVARREGVPAAAAYRSLDAEGEDGEVIHRYLDRAAFKAAQEGEVTVVGTTRPETVKALVEWAVEGRAATVALAPVTAVLLAD